MNSRDAASKSGISRFVGGLFCCVLFGVGISRLAYDCVSLFCVFFGGAHAAMRYVGLASAVERKDCYMEAVKGSRWPSIHM